VKLNSDDENDSHEQSQCKEGILAKVKRAASEWLDDNFFTKKIKVDESTQDVVGVPIKPKSEQQDVPSKPTEQPNSIPIKQKPVQPPVQTNQGIPLDAVPTMAFTPMYDANKRLIEILHTQDVPCTYDVHPDLQEKVNVLQQLNTDAEYGVRTNDVHTKNAQNFEEQYGRVLVCIKNGVLTNVSHPTLRSHGYKNPMIHLIREKLVRDGIAVMRGKNRCVLVARGKK
jgi:hypothetical protein